MNFRRAGGILLHPTSLPGRYGIGDLGPQAIRFVDWLALTGSRLWQVLPLGPTGYGDSPYQCFSAFAGNPYLISPDLLIQDGFLTPDDLQDIPDFSPSRLDSSTSLRVNFGLIIPWKLNLLQKAFDRFPSTSEAIRKAFDYFCAQNAAWLEGYSLFMALKETNGGGAWNNWPKPLKKRDQRAMIKALKTHSDRIARFSFYQFLFFRQWNALRVYAKQRGIQSSGMLQYLWLMTARTYGRIPNCSFSISRAIRRLSPASP